MPSPTLTTFLASFVLFILSITPASSQPGYGVRISSPDNGQVLDGSHETTGAITFTFTTYGLDLVPRWVVGAWLIFFMMMMMVIVVMIVMRVNRWRR